MVWGMRVIASRCGPALSVIASTTMRVPVHLLRPPLVPLHALPTLSNLSQNNLHPRQSFGGQRALVTAASGGDAASATFKLIVYSKEDCPLCDKLKEKLEAMRDRAEFLPSILTGVELEVRDITSNPAWEAAYSMSVPVLVAADPDGSNEVRIT